LDHYAIKSFAMKYACLLFLLIFFSVFKGSAQQLPDGYILQYGQNFTASKSIGDFWYTRPAHWSLGKEQNNFFLELSSAEVPDSQVSTLPPYRCILKNSIYGDFILEVDVNPKESGHAPEVCFFLGLRDSTRYYFILLSTGDADDRQGIYLVKNSVCTKLPERISTARALLPNTWQKIRVERNITRRTIRVFAGEMSAPVLEIQNYELVMGRIGFGSLNGNVSFDNLSVWAPTVIPEEGEEE
jgi:hypothetical protein